jgi:hypothetical protein
MDTEHETGCVTPNELAAEAGRLLSTVRYHFKQLFPALRCDGNKTLLTPEQAEAVRKRMGLDKKGCITARELAAQLGFNASTFNNHMRRLFPDLAFGGRTTLLTPEQVETIMKDERLQQCGIRKKNREAGKEIIKDPVKEQERFPRCDIRKKNREAGKDPVKFVSRMVDYSFPMKESSESWEDETHTYWIKTGAAIRDGKLVILRPIETAKPGVKGPLIRRPPGEEPLQRGLHNMGGIR